MSSPSAPALYSVILPTYNERQNLPLIVSMLDATFTAHALSYEVVVVDDNSPDKTGDVAERLQAVLGREKVVVLRRAGKLGLGSAYRDGLRKCSGQWVILMDADFSHHVSRTAQHPTTAAAVSLLSPTALLPSLSSHPPSPPCAVPRRQPKFIPAFIQSAQPSPSPILSLFPLLAGIAVEAQARGLTPRMLSPLPCAAV